MAELTRIKLNKILEEHKHWINEDCKNWKEMRADLSDVDLSGANLHNADLRGALLNNADLRGALLSNATGIFLLCWGLPFLFFRLRIVCLF